ncbi:MAG: response regulator [Elusimicrobia bacterium]|nr:response regulator [Elusimicrobiota bacterium]
MSENKTDGAGRKKVLIVDDDEMIRATLKIALDYAGFKSVDSGDAESACGLAEQSSPDVILLDLYMPGINGIEILKNLKAEKSTARIPVIIFTGSGEVKDVMEGINAGAFDYIVKPVDSKLLVEKIRKALKVGPQS